MVAILEHFICEYNPLIGCNVSPCFVVNKANRVTHNKSE